MKNNDDRFDRNILLFGAEGQTKLRGATVCVIGAGGLGTHTIQQLALLGVGKIISIDDEELSTSNKNRYVGARYDDPVPGSKKTSIAQRLVESIDPSIKFEAIQENVLSPEAFQAIKKAGYVFGCLDDDGPRFVINDLTTAYAIPYVDLASDVVGNDFGGRVIINWDGCGCLYCLDELDATAVQSFLETNGERINRETVYGVAKKALQTAGPSVVSVNGVIASLAVTEFMAACTGLRKPIKFINYDGGKGRAIPRNQEPHAGCPYCTQWGLRDAADIDRYIRFLNVRNK